MSSREEQQAERYQASIDRLALELARLRAEYRRVCEELDWRDEKIRVLERVIVRLGADN